MTFQYYYCSVHLLVKTAIENKNDFSKIREYMTKKGQRNI